MARAADLLFQLAERPDDRALRLVFADVLLEEGDERGEVIALCERGSLSLTEQRRVARITTARAAEWLGPLAPLADLQRTRFVAGFLDELVCVPNVARELFISLIGDPRLATVHGLSVAPVRRPARLAGFLGHPFLRRLERLELGSTDWQALRNFKAQGLAPSRVTLASWGVFAQELAPLSDVPLFQQATSLGLSTTEFITPSRVDEVRTAVLSQARALRRVEELTLVARYGVLEGIAAWLLACDREPRQLKTQFPMLTRWGAESGDVFFQRTGEPGGPFNQLSIDLSAPEAMGEKRAASHRPAAEMRIATAASVLVLLGAAQLTAVEIKLPAGGRLRNNERHALHAAARRSGTLEHFSIIGESSSP